MTERERLIGLIQNAVDGCARHWAEVIADYLLAHGAIMPPCKVGDEVYVIYDTYVTGAKVLAFYVDALGGMVNLKIYTDKETVCGRMSIIDNDNYTFDDVFLTREEAEAALRRRRRNERSKYSPLRKHL